MEKIAKPPKNFQLIKAIRGYKQGDNPGEKSLHKANIKRRDTNVRKFVDANVDIKTRKKILPGQLIMFNYFEPKTKEQLQYYDAMPCTIFFGTFKTADGLRVLGFNIHYYPPRIRYQLMDKIFDIFRGTYMRNWDKTISTEISDISYKMLIHQLQKAKLDFGVREYIPSLMAKITPIPPMYWQKAVFTEGHFRKETREQILNYWKNKSDGIEKPKRKQKQSK